MQWILLLPVLIVSIVFHEVAHAWVARREGDPTAEREGRITLNPIPHLDPVGSLLVPAALLAMGTGFIFGWAKPVPVNRANIQTGAAGDIRVSLAGIVVNLLLAVLFAAVLFPLTTWMDTGPGTTAAILVDVAYYGVLINLILAVFNLIPVPPLDGSHVLEHMLPEPLRDPYRRLGSIGAIALLAVLFLVPGGFAVVMGPVYFLADLLFVAFGVRGSL
ncbi:MAG: site-2 protease family protein [Gemmatimonadota bacterium]